MDIIKHRRWFFLISGLLVAASIGALSVPPTLNPGIDFTGGSALTVEFVDAVEAQDARNALASGGFDEAVVQSIDARTLFVRTDILRAEERDANGNLITPGGRAAVESAFEPLGAFTITSVDTVSGVVGAENVRNAIIAVIVASVAILLYVTWAFRRVPNSFRYGTTAIIALLHDVLIVLGLFSLLGKVANMEVNAMFITGVLTVIGYSVNDTIVVFDRLRENVGRYQGATLSEIGNLSVRETIGRSLNTSLTLLIVVVALMLFGGPSIQPLLLVLLAGVVVGTYSSIFVATLLLIAWEQGEIGRGLRRILPLGAARRRPA